MPFGKERNRCIYIAALIISFLLIVGSIYLHLRQKTHLGRISFNSDHDHIEPTSGVETSTWMNEYDLKFTNNTRFQTGDDTNVDNDILEASSAEDDDDDDDDENDLNIYRAHLREYQWDPEVHEDSNEKRNENGDKNVDEIIDEMNEGIEKNFDYGIVSLQQDSSACLRCLCMTVSECRPTFCGSGNPCGLYRISKMYWIDGGRPTIAGGSTDNEDQDYLTCVNEDTCSTTVIRQYYSRFKRDCNKDGKFDCRDQIALHILGPSGCLKADLSHVYANRMRNCFIESNLNYFSYSSEEDY